MKAACRWRNRDTYKKENKKQNAAILRTVFILIDILADCMLALQLESRWCAFRHYDRGDAGMAD